MRAPDIAVLYPSTRRVAYSSLAFHMFKTYFPGQGVATEAYFLEDGLVVPETRGRSISEANIILVSLPYEVMYADLVKSLDSAGIPVWRSERRGTEPVIIAGGPAVTANPLPLYDIVDAFLIGEAEPVLDELVNATRLEDRDSILSYLAGIEGFLVPGFNEKTRRVYARSLDTSWYPVRQHVPREVEPVWGRSFMLETSRGCGRMCRFCMEGFIFRPKRDRSLKRLIELLDEGVRESRVSKVSFYSLSFFDSPHVDSLLEEAVSRGLEVSVPSLRAETLTPERARLIARGGQRTVTIAPETGSCRLGRAINKCIGREGALRAVEAAVEGGIRNVKMYIIVGFPGEAEDDVRETIGMIEEASLVLARAGGSLRVSINPFIPKPVTPLQWAPLPSRVYVEGVVGRIVKAARMKNARASWYDYRWAMLQVVLGRGGRELGPVIVDWARRGGRLGTFRTALRRHGLDVGAYTGERPPEWTPPWHQLVEHPYASLRMLRMEYEAYSSTITGPR